MSKLKYFLAFVSIFPCYCLNNYIIINVSTCILLVYTEDHDLIRFYRVGVGQQGAFKTSQWDMKTPTGNYKILWKASVYYKKDGGYPITKNRGFYNSSNNYSYFKKKHSVPLFSTAFGEKDAIFMCINYPNPSDRRKGYTGDGIAIYATYLGGVGSPSSLGCIRMNPSDARELYNLVEEGCSVILNE